MVCGLVLDGLLCLLLGSDKQDLLAVLDLCPDCLVSLNDAGRGLLQVDDVDSVPLGEDETGHLRIPSLCLMSEVYA